MLIANDELNYSNMYQLTQKCFDILDVIWYTADRVFNDSSKNWWTIGKSRKFVALGLTKKEWVEKWLLEEVPDNPLRDLCERNALIPHEWIAKNINPVMYTRFLEWMGWQAQTEYGVYACDVRRFLNINSL